MPEPVAVLEFGGTSCAPSSVASNSVSVDIVATFDAADVPIALTVDTIKSYDVPLVNPVTVPPVVALTLSLNVVYVDDVDSLYWMT